MYYVFYRGIFFNSVVNSKNQKKKLIQKFEKRKHVYLPAQKATRMFYGIVI